METWLPSTETAEGLKTLSLHMCVWSHVWRTDENWWFCLNGVAWINTCCSPVTAESRSVAACAGRTASHIALFIISFRKIYFHSVPIWHLYCQHLFPLLTCSVTLAFVCTWVCLSPAWSDQREVQAVGWISPLAHREQGDDPFTQCLYCAA